MASAPSEARPATDSHLKETDLYRPGIRRAAVTAAALAASLATPSAAAPLAGAAAGAPAAGATAASASLPAASPPLLLINGDRMLPGRDGPPRLAVAQPAGSLSAVLSFFACGRRSEVPATALPYLGRGLDPSLFSLSALQRAEQGGRLPLRISYRGARPELPGVTITQTGHGRADGYLTAESARRFGTALRRQFLADHARGSYGTDGLFARGVSISLPGAARPRGRADFPEHILTVRGTSLAGRPDSGDLVEVFDVGHCFRLIESNIFFHGVTKFAVPSGRDWAVGEFASKSGLRLVVLPQFSVDRNTTVRLDERRATSRITFSTPRPARAVTHSFTVIRSSRSTVMGFGWMAVGGDLWVSPVRRPPSFGTLQAYTGGQLTSPPGPGTPYAYTLDFPAPRGTIPAQHYVARAAGLATIRENFFQDVPGTGHWITTGGTAAQWAVDGGLSLALPVRMPGRQIQYLSAGPRMFWQTQTAGPDFLGGQAGPIRSYRAGRQVSVDWNRYPLHPGPNVVTPRSLRTLLVLPSASRAGNVLTLDIAPFGDSAPGHVAGPLSGFGFPAAGRYALFQNGRKIASGNAARAARGFADLLLTARLSPRPSAIRFTLTATRASKQFALSATSSDVWTWRSRPDAGAAVPAPWICGLTARRLPRPGRHCAVQGMLTARYRVAGIGAAGTARPGSQQIGLDIRRLQLAARSRITRARVQVSFDKGKTWHGAAVSGTTDGGFRAAFDAPAGALVSLRTHAADAAGDTITETILGAYRTSATAG